MEQLDNIQNLIHIIRGQRVMLDFDLARLYHVETGELKRQVRRNIERFEGDDFMFELSHEELLRCQIGTSSWGGSRYGAFAFTEIGVARHCPNCRNQTTQSLSRPDPSASSARMRSVNRVLLQNHQQYNQRQYDKHYRSRKQNHHPARSAGDISQPRCRTLWSGNERSQSGY